MKKWILLGFLLACFKTFAETPDSSCLGIVRETFPQEFMNPTRQIFVALQAKTSSDTLKQIFVVKSFEEGVALLRPGLSDQLFLKRGETYVLKAPINASKLIGKSTFAPLVIGAYGSGPRPILITKGSQGFLNAIKPLQNVVLQDLNLKADRSDKQNAEGIRLAGAAGGKNLLLRNLRIESYRTNISIDTLGFQNLVLEKSEILDAYSIQGGHSQGLYADKVKGLLIQDNLFDHNGWKTRTGGEGQATIFNHNLYIQSMNQCVQFERNISMRASATGLQMRAGGMVQENFFYRNPVHLTYGLVDGGSVQEKHIPFGVSGTVSGNLFMVGEDLDDKNPRDGGVYLANILRAEFQDNIIAHHFLGNARGSGLNLVAKMGLGIHSLIVQKNVVYGVKSRLLIEGSAYGAVTVKSDNLGGAGVWKNQSLAISPVASGLAMPSGKLENIADSGTIFNSNLFQTSDADFLDLNAFKKDGIVFLSSQAKPSKFKDPSRSVKQALKVGSDEEQFALIRLPETNERVVIMTSLKQGFELVP